MSNAVILEGSTIGKNCTIFPNAVIGAVPQDLKYKGEKTTVEIGDNTTIRECVTVNKGTSAKNKTVIGSNCLLMAYTHAAHDCLIGDSVILANAVQLAGEVVVDDFAIIGGTTAVHQFCRIGTHSMISGGSLIRKDIPPYIKAGREPVVYVGVNSVGLRRRQFSNEIIDQIQEVYRNLYLKGYNNTDAIKAIEETIPSSTERNIILEFVKNSDRGIIRAGIA
jgi:UDP-N-acetylglucosamine acyltransferase